MLYKPSTQNASNDLIHHFFQGCELAIGNINGELLVYKGTDSNPWRKASELGMVGLLDANFL